MCRQLIILTSVAALAGSLALAQEAQSPAAAHEEDFSALLAALPESPHTLASGIEQVATGSEVPNEAKFEMEYGELMLSVYTSEAGLAVIPEENVFKEYKGLATGTAWDPEVEVFEDFAHIARSAQYHTLLSITEVTIPEIIEKASADGDTVISVKAKVREGRPVFEVFTAVDGMAEETLYDLMTGEPVG